MVTLYYDVSFIASLVLMLAYVFMWHKHFDVRITLIFAFVPVAELGYSLMAHAQTLEAALMARKLVYLGGCYLQLFLMLAVLRICRIKVKRWVRLALFALSTAVYLSTLSIGILPLFYKSVSIERVGDVLYFHKEYAFMHSAFYVMVLSYLFMSVGAVIYSYVRLNQVSRKTLLLMFMTDFVALVCFFGGRLLGNQIEYVAGAYLFALVVYLVIVYRMCLYEVTDTAVDSLVQTGSTGLASFDFNHNYLGSNGTAKRIFPELLNLTVDLPLANDPFVADNVTGWLAAFAEDEHNNEAYFERDGHSYLITTGYLYNGKRKCGYQLFITDDTERQRYVNLLNTYNADLEREVEHKTQHIELMHDKLILGMATMVESRDNSTGGHIRRTSEGVRLLIEQIRRDPGSDLSDDFCHDLVKAAPMHDLGKIAVDDAILRKPGRFTPEEFEQMKTHAAEGARIVESILADTDDEDFRRIAVNVAHYHHERWDGSGYPEGLAGEEIPIEARIMAIADVYDALVSKRVYKERMSFEKANAIIMEGMGTQFDQGLERFYLAARPQLERYYGGLE